MFGLSFGELCVLIVVAIVVIGPKDMPKVLRKLGQWSGRLRRMAADVRVQSGIDEVLRNEGLTKDLTEIRRLARGEFQDAASALTIRDTRPAASGLVVEREREYPREGPDNCSALPDTAVVYADTLPASTWAHDPLYGTGAVTGDAVAEVPPTPEDATVPAPTPSSPDARRA